jgi:hypothetical protein
MATDKSFSASHVDEIGKDNSPACFVSLRSKRVREDDLPGEFIKFRDEMRNMITSFISTQQSQLGEMVADIKEIRQTNYNIENSIAILSSQNEELRKKVELLESQVKRDHDCIVVQENRIEDLQRMMRKSNIEIKNVPRRDRENTEDLINMVLSLGKNISLDLEKRDIKDIFRLQVKKGENGPILLELGSTTLKQELIKRVKNFNAKSKTKLQAKHLGHTTREDTPVFVSEQLTAKNARLHFLAGELVKSSKYKYRWTSFGRVLVRQDDNSKIIHITSEAQINQLLKSA